MTSLSSSNFIRVAALLGALAVALGAFGAHALAAQLEQTGKADIWKTAAFYHLVHAVAMLAIAAHAPQRRFACGAWTLGILFFSGSLYLLALHPSWKWLGPVTPLGGAFLLAGWICLMWKPSVQP